MLRVGTLLPPLPGVLKVRSGSYFSAVPMELPISHSGAVCPDQWRPWMPDNRCFGCVDKGRGQMALD